MINALNFRIDYCKEQIEYYEYQIHKSKTDSQKNYYRGIAEGFRCQLKTLQELLVTAKKSIELSETA